MQHKNPMMKKTITLERDVAYEYVTALLRQTRPNLIFVAPFHAIRG